MMKAMLLALSLFLSAAPPNPQAIRRATVSELDAPVCVPHDPDQDVYFVSNINGAGTAKDDNGYISRVGPDGQLTERLCLPRTPYLLATLNFSYGDR